MLPPANAAGSPPLVFSFLINGIPTRAAGEAMEDRIGVLLAGYPQAPPLDGLGPLPPG